MNEQDYVTRLNAKVDEARRNKCSTLATKLIRLLFCVNPSLAYDLANWLWNRADHTMKPEPTWDAMYADLPMVFHPDYRWLLLTKKACLYRLRTGDFELVNYQA